MDPKDPRDSGWDHPAESDSPVGITAHSVLSKETRKKLVLSKETHPRESSPRGRQDGDAMVSQAGEGREWSDFISEPSPAPFNTAGASKEQRISILSLFA